MADERYTLEVSTKIKGDLQQGLKSVAETAKKTVKSVDKIGQEIGQINPKPIRDLQKAGADFGRTMDKLKPRSLNEMSMSAKRLKTQLNTIKPKAIQDVGKAAKDLHASLNKVKPKGLESVSRVAKKLWTNIKAIKPKPLDMLSMSAKKLKKNISAIDAKPIKSLSYAAKDVANNVNKIKPTPFHSLSRAIEQSNSRVLNFISNLILMGNNLQGLVLLAVNRLKAAFVDMTDQLNRVIGQMEKFAETSQEAARLVDQLQGIAVATGWDMDALSSSFTKLALGFEHLELGTDKLMQMVKGLGLLFRQVGADGNQMAKIAGQIGQMFTRETVPFEKLESLLGRGRFEQILKDLADQLLRIKGINLGNWGARTQNVLAKIKELMDDGAISGRDLAEAWINLLTEGSKLSEMASEIGHGFDKLKQAVIVLITRLDQAIGFSTTLASVFSLLADAVKLLADNVEVLLKLGFIAALSYMAVNLPKIYGWVVALIAVFAGAAGKLKPVLDILKKVASNAKVIKGVVGGAITALVAFGKELDALLAKWEEKFGHMAIFKVLRAITKALSQMEDIADKVTGKKKGEAPPQQPGKPPGTIGELNFNQGPPGERDKIPKFKTVKEIQAELEAEKATVAAGREEYKKDIQSLEARRKKLIDQLVNDLPGLDVNFVHEQLQAVFKDFLGLQSKHGTTLRQSPELRAQYKADYKKFGHLSESSEKNPFAKTVGPELDPKIFLTGLRGEVAGIRNRIKSAQANLQMGRIDKKEFKEVMAGLSDQLKDAVLRGSHELQLRGLPGGEKHKTSVWSDIKRLETLLLPFKKKEETAVAKAIRELGERQQDAFRAKRRGDITPEEYAREQVGFYHEGRGLKRQFSDELDVRHPEADKAAEKLGVKLGGIIEDAANYLPPQEHIFAGYSEQLENLKTAFKEGRIESEEFIEGMHNVGKGIRQAEIANFKAVADDPALAKIVDDIKKQTHNAVEYFKPLNTGVRNLGTNLVNLTEAQRAGYLTGDKLGESYRTLNQNAKDYLAANAALLKTNPELIAQLKRIIKLTEGFALAAKKAPEPKGAQEEFAQYLGFGPAKGEKDPGKVAEGLSQRQQAGSILTQGATTAIDRVYEEGTQGRDFGPAGDITKDFAKNVITMGPALAGLIAALQLITEIFVQAADMANLFGEGLQMFFDPLNELITIIADTLSPVFNILGNIFASVGHVLGGFVSIVKPIFKVIKSVFQVIQAIATPFKVLANVVGLVMKAIGVLYQKALQPLVNFFTNLAKTIISMVNSVIRVINKLIPGTRWDLDYVSLEGKRHVPPEEKEEEVKDKARDDKADKQRAKMLAELTLLRRINQDMEKELRIQAQAAREVVRVKEIGSITEARQRGVISQEQASNNPQPLNLRIVATLDPREVDQHMASESSQRVQLTNIRMNREGIRAMVS